MRYIVFDLETKTWFDGTNGSEPADLDLSIVCIYDSETDSYGSFLEEQLPNLWPILERADMLIGYNSDHFDIPILNKYYHGDLTRIRSLDLMKEVKEVIGRRVSLDQIAEATLGKKKIGSGLQALTWWKQGDIDNLRKYCTEDVRITKEIYDYAVAHSSLKYKIGPDVAEVKLNTSGWTKVKEPGGMTFSLPF